VTELNQQNAIETLSK